MKPIYVFYHFFAPPGSDWTWALNQQLLTLRKSGLVPFAKVNMHITGHVDLAYIERRYPFVNVMDVRGIGEQNIFEGQTLKAIWSHQFEPDARILYMHNKGATSNSPYVAAWRETLNHEMITNWTKCYGLLHHYDVVGISDSHVIRSNSVITSGNFWWATAEYLSKLPDPIDSTQYLDKHHPGDHDYRYCFERWITSGNPKLVFSCDMNVDPYIEYYFVEEHNIDVH